MKLRFLLAIALLLNPAFARTTRSAAARRTFAQKHPCPATGEPKGACPGYVVDHVIALACGGPDAPENMQWQTVEDGKAKDKIERKDCRTKVIQVESDSK